MCLTGFEIPTLGLKSLSQVALFHWNLSTAKLSYSASSRDTTPSCLEIHCHYTRILTPNLWNGRREQVMRDSSTFHDDSNTASFFHFQVLPPLLRDPLAHDIASTSPCRNSVGEIDKKLKIDWNRLTLIKLSKRTSSLTIEE